MFLKVAIASLNYVLLGLSGTCLDVDIYVLCTLYWLCTNYSIKTFPMKCVCGVSKSASLREPGRQLISYSATVDTAYAKRNFPRCSAQKFLYASHHSERADRSIWCWRLSHGVLRMAYRSLHFWIRPENSSYWMRALWIPFWLNLI